MQVSRDDIRHCIEQAQDLREHYKIEVLNGNATRKSIDQLHLLIRNYLNKDVTVEDVQVQKNSIAAFYMAMRDGSYRVVLLSGLDDNERRFALCKELFHVVLDEVGCRNMSIYSHISEVVAALPVPDSTPSRSTISEALAEIAAMEFMFPYAERLTFLANGNGNPNYSQCAERYGVPQRAIEVYCADRMMEFLGQF